MVDWLRDELKSSKSTNLPYLLWSRRTRVYWGYCNKKWFTGGLYEDHLVTLHLVPVDGSQEDFVFAGGAESFYQVGVYVSIHQRLKQRDGHQIHRRRTSWIQMKLNPFYIFISVNKLYSMSFFFYITERSIWF